MLQLYVFISYFDPPCSIISAQKQKKQVIFSELLLHNALLLSEMKHRCSLSHFSRCKSSWRPASTRRMRTNINANFTCSSSVIKCLFIFYTKSGTSGTKSSRGVNQLLHGKLPQNLVKMRVCCSRGRVSYYETSD